MKKQDNEDGFHLIAIPLLIIVVAIIGFAGWYVYSVNKKAQDSMEHRPTPENWRAPSVATPTPTPTPTAYVPTPTPSAGPVPDFSTAWKTYTNQTGVSFQFSYPAYASINDRYAENMAAITVEVQDINTVEDNDHANQQAYRNDIEAIKNGDPTVKQSWDLPMSYKLLNISGGYGKSAMNFGGGACEGGINVVAHVYKGDYLVKVTYEFNDLALFRQYNPGYVSDNLCLAYASNTSEDPREMVYTHLESGSLDSISQQWYADFYKMMDTFKFN